MKTKIIISLLGLLFISGAFGDGCDDKKEPTPDYIIVIVTTSGSLLREDVTTRTPVCDDVTRDIIIRIDIIKDGGERFNFFATTDELCNFNSTETATFKLYKEQPIEIIAYAEQVPGEYTQVRAVDYLSWDEVYPYNEFGSTYNYHSDANIVWLED